MAREAEASLRLDDRSGVGELLLEPARFESAHQCGRILSLYLRGVLMDANLVTVIAQMACEAATRAAQNGAPIRVVAWVPPQTATSDWRGTLFTTEQPARTAAG